MPTRVIAIFVLLTLVSLPSFAQKRNEKFQLNIKRSAGPIHIDGSESDEAWTNCDVATDFAMVLPMDTSHALLRTEVRMTYDDHMLYVLATCYDSDKPGPYMVESLRRDFNFVKNDNFIFFMDPFDDQTNGFTFGANAAGAQWDGTMYSGGSVDLSWDNKWYSEVRQYEDRYVFEAAIPFKSIRYKKGITRWGINFSRNDLKTTEKSAWAPVPRQFPTASLAYTGILVWDQAPPIVGPNVSVIPYGLGGINRDIQNKESSKYRKEFGGDAKVAITSSLNLDLTVNPDFSQVDVDRQVTNLDRFELFFPERRQFFLENGDLFNNFGYATIRPFFSRRIGLHEYVSKTGDKFNLAVPIQFGARLSGKINRNWRIGAMDMQTDKIDSIGLPRQNFAVIALQRRLFARSNIGFIFINKESLDYKPSADSGVTNYAKYNRTAGLEYNLASANNQVTGKMLFLKTFAPGKDGKDFVHAANILFSTRRYALSWQQEYIGKNLTAEVGYIPRSSYIRMNPAMSFFFFPRGRHVLSHGPQLTSSLFFNTGFKPTDNETIASYLTTFRSRATLNVWASHSFVQLLSPFDPTNSGLETLATGTRHFWNSYGVDVVSKPQSVFTYLVSLRNGGYYANGTRFTFTNEMGYRFQPYVSILLSSSYNSINLPETSGRTNFWLVGPRLDVTMTNKLFVTAFAQYNDQKENVNLNARLQWRYRPASDLFIVYTDNYFPQDFGVKNRALVVKFTYWWSL